MKIKEIPFRIWIMDITPELLRNLKEVRSLEIFESGTNNLKADGLFSTEIFGPLGSDERDSRFGYINLNTKIFHPLYFKRLGALKQLYMEICTGKRYAVWDEKEKDFFPSDEVEGKTGFAFFVKHFPELTPAHNQSSARSVRIRLIEENRSKALRSDVLVQPAGIRDIQVEASGRTTEDEINKYYRSLIATSNSITSSEVTRNDPVIDTARMSLQRNFVAINDHVMNLLNGKGGFILGKFASRKIRNGTANVISPIQTAVDMLGTGRAPGINGIQTGLAQTFKGMPEVVIHFLRTGWLSYVMGNSAEGYVPLVNPKTLKRGMVDLSPEEMERWTTIDGLNKIINRFVKFNYRQIPIKLDGHYLGLLYHGPEGFRIFGDIDELPEGFDRKQVSPLNLTSLLYLSGYRNWNKYVGILTRYPVAGSESTIRGNLYVKSTTKAFQKMELDDNWQPKGDDYVCFQFPDQSPDATFIETLSPHIAAYPGLGADNDGDRCTLTILYSIQSISEFEEHKRKREWYVKPDGSLRFSSGLDNIELVFANITGGPEG